jgi:hypothetical protein
MQRPSVWGKSFGQLKNKQRSFKTLLTLRNQYEPFWKLLTPEASAKVRRGNYERIFDEARRKVRSWEAANIK